MSTTKTLFVLITTLFLVAFMPAAHAEYDEYCGDYIVNGDEQCDGDAPLGYVCIECELVHDDDFCIEEVSLKIQDEQQEILLNDIPLCDEPYGLVTIRKEAWPADGTDFEFYIGADEELDETFYLDHALPDDNDEVLQEETFELPAGEYLISELLPPESDWELVHVECEGDEYIGETIDYDYHLLLAPGAEVTCTFYNYRDPQNCEELFTFLTHHAPGHAHDHPYPHGDMSLEEWHGLFVSECGDFICEELPGILEEGDFHPELEEHLLEGIDMTCNEPQTCEEIFVYLNENGDEELSPEEEEEFEELAAYFLENCGKFICLEIDDLLEEVNDDEAEQLLIEYYGRFCEQPDEDMTCEEAIAQGLLYGTVDGEHAVVVNDADQDFVVSLASYQMFAASIHDQVLYDYHTIEIEGGSEEELWVKVPACGYQIDLVCGEPLEPPFYTEEEKLDFDFGNQGDWCQQERRGDGVELVIQNGFPQDNNYVFECNADFDADSYDWYFGDGHVLLDVPLATAYHTYEASGEYLVACTARNENTADTDTLEIEVEVEEPSLKVVIHPDYPQGNDVVFFCLAENWEPTSYDWEFDDGEKLYDLAVPDVYHTFAEGGMYDVTCLANDGDTTLTDTIWFMLGDHKDEDTCTDSVADYEVSCDGDVTQDIFTGDCRHVTCEDGDNEVSVLACDKPDEADKTHFEMYRQSGSGIQVCIGDTCIDENDFAVSEEFPVCEEPEEEVELSTKEETSSEDESNEENGQHHGGESKYHTIAETYTQEVYTPSQDTDNTLEPEVEEEDAVIVLTPAEGEIPPPPDGLALTGSTVGATNAASGWLAALMILLLIGLAGTAVHLRTKQEALYI